MLNAIATVGVHAKNDFYLEDIFRFIKMDIDLLEVYRTFVPIYYIFINSII